MPQITYYHNGAIACRLWNADIKADWDKAFRSGTEAESLFSQLLLSCRSKPNADIVDQRTIRSDRIRTKFVHFSMSELLHAKNSMCRVITGTKPRSRVRCQLTSAERSIATVAFLRASLFGLVEAFVRLYGH